MGKLTCLNEMEGIKGLSWDRVAHHTGYIGTENKMSWLSWNREDNWTSYSRTERVKGLVKLKSNRVDKLFGYNGTKIVN